MSQAAETFVVKQYPAMTPKPTVFRTSFISTKPVRECFEPGKKTATAYGGSFRKHDTAEFLGCGEADKGGEMCGESGRTVGAHVEKDGIGRLGLTLHSSVKGQIDDSHN